ncbi:DUF2920 family protein [Brevibacillus sp. GCM10020057]|uniref:DUF2920 family protein n=1 Tax=Brevibacillus sp. GCM10020057 TaxID=3317327 RepID=UPI00362B4CB6
MSTLKFMITPHADIELFIKRDPIDYYVSIPGDGVTNDTGVILSIPGFGGTADSEYYSQKLNPYLAERYNCIVVSMNYFGIHRTRLMYLDNSFKESMEKLYHTPVDYWDHITSDVELKQRIVKVLESKGMQSLDPRCQILRVTGRNEYQSFGFLPTLDCLTVLGDIFKRFPQVNKQKVIAYGSSYGGYIAMLCGKFAPNTFSLIIENSGFSRAEINFMVGREILKSDFVMYQQHNEKVYSMSCAYNNPWTILDETSKFYLSDSHKLIRSLLVEEHRVPSETRYYHFHCEQDNIASVEDKDRVISLLRRYNPTFYKRVGQGDIDGVLFKKYGHAMEASLRKLFDYVAELDAGSQLLKRTPTNEFLENATRVFNCGEKDYYFHFKDDFSLEVKIESKVKRTDYSQNSSDVISQSRAETELPPVIKSQKLLEQLKRVSDSILDSLGFVISKVEQDELEPTKQVMQEIIDAYLLIMSQLESLHESLQFDQISILNDEIVHLFTVVVHSYNHHDSYQLKQVLSQQLYKLVVDWKAEIDHMLEPYLT